MVINWVHLPPPFSLAPLSVEKSWFCSEPQKPVLMMAGNGSWVEWGSKRQRHRNWSSGLCPGSRFLTSFSEDCPVGQVASLCLLRKNGLEEDPASTLGFLLLSEKQVETLRQCWGCETALRVIHPSRQNSGFNETFS